MTFIRICANDSHKFYICKNGKFWYAIAEKKYKKPSLNASMTSKHTSKIKAISCAQRWAEWVDERF